MRYSKQLAACCFLLLVPQLQAGPMLHPQGKPLPTRQQGPFVTTGDGGILCVDGTHAHNSADEGKTWTSTPLFQSPEKYQVSNERALFRTRNGTVIAAWMNMKERQTAPGSKWGGTPEEFDQWVLPTYICRSLDDGKTWEAPQLLHRPWCGCIHSMIQTKSGRIVLVGQTIIPEWRHATMTFVSDDEGQTWKMSNILDNGIGRHDHAGSCEATILERADHTLYMLLRTESGYFYEAESSNEGLTWNNLRKSNIRSVTCCGNMYRLSDGRAVLLWNHPLRTNPDDTRNRFELSLAFSSDDGATWTGRTVIAAQYPDSANDTRRPWVAYPYLYERHPGELWITTMQGDLRMQIPTAAIPTGEAPLPETVNSGKAHILFVGDSTTAPRPKEVQQVYSQRLASVLSSSHPNFAIINSGVPSSTISSSFNRVQSQLSLFKTDLVVIQFGINDAAVDVWKNPPATEPRVPLKAFVRDLREIIAGARASGAKVILMTTNPTRWGGRYKELYGKPPYDPNAEDGFDRPFLSQYNQAVRDLAAELNLPLIDLHELYLKRAQEQQVPVDSLLLDGVHPNDKGHALVAEALLPVIQKVLDQK